MSFKTVRNLSYRLNKISDILGLKILFIEYNQVLTELKGVSVPLPWLLFRKEPIKSQKVSNFLRSSTTKNTRHYLQIYEHVLKLSVKYLFCDKYFEYVTIEEIFFLTFCCDNI